ncbi:type II toxin-antitoxin system VapC family toxin [Caulobacter sp. CCNWLY153]|uniref:type II toxin-antitoxin system VapC family toxin n=1 Tax=unclassified Caulobacter TaxID=2648921 RepID=UPI002FF35E5E
MAAFVLDTNVAIHLRDGDPVISAKIAGLDGAVLLSIVSRVELEGGVYRELADAARRARLDAMLDVLPVLDFGAEAADAYRAIVPATGHSRRKILDRMIAAQALTHRATLVTCNPADFLDVPGLALLAW